MRLARLIVDHGWTCSAAAKMFLVASKTARKMGRAVPGRRGHADEKATTAIGVLRRVVAWFAEHGLTVERVLSDHGPACRSHTWRDTCAQLGITPKRTGPYRPQTIRKRLSEEIRALRGANSSAVIRTLNPIVRGWAAYYRGVVSTETFQSLDHHLWTLTYKWALYRHNRRSKYRIVNRYYGQFHPARRDRWVFGDRDSGAFLVQFGWTKIVRHDMVKGRASPDDPALTEYWAKRRRRNRDVPPIGRTRTLLLKKQKGRCPLCGSLLLHTDHQPRSPEEWGQWAAATRKAITVNAIAHTGSGLSDDKEQRLVHEHCRRRSLRQTGISVRS